MSSTHGSPAGEDADFDMLSIKEAADRDCILKQGEAVADTVCYSSRQSFKSAKQTAVEK